MGEIVRRIAELEKQVKTLESRCDAMSSYQGEQMNEIQIIRALLGYKGWKEEFKKMDEMNADERIRYQTREWKLRFYALREGSPQKEYNWVIANYRRDQRDLDALFKEYKENEG